MEWAHLQAIEELFAKVKAKQEDILKEVRQKGDGGKKLSDRLKKLAEEEQDLNRQLSDALI